MQCLVQQLATAILNNDLLQEKHTTTTSTNSSGTMACKTAKTTIHTHYKGLLVLWSLATVWLHKTNPTSPICQQQCLQRHQWLVPLLPASKRSTSSLETSILSNDKTWFCWTNSRKQSSASTHASFATSSLLHLRTTLDRRQKKDRRYGHQTNSWLLMQDESTNVPSDPEVT